MTLAGTDLVLSFELCWSTVYVQHPLTCTKLRNLFYNNLLLWYSLTKLPN